MRAANSSGIKNAYSDIARNFGTKRKSPAKAGTWSTVIPKDGQLTLQNVITALEIANTEHKKSLNALRDISTYIP